MVCPSARRAALPPLAVEDQGTVIAVILADPAHARQTHPLSAPVEPTPPEIAAIVTQTLGKEVRYEKIAAEQSAPILSPQQPDVLFMFGEIGRHSGIDHRGGTCCFPSKATLLTSTIHSSIAEQARDRREPPRPT
jgi:uncharacterized protein YbjT (DUF2867 family)